MSIIDNTPEQNRMLQYFIDTGNSNFRFIRAYKVDIEDGIIEFEDTDYDGGDYTVVGPIVKDETTGNHGLLNGLDQDDHTQYLTEARHDGLPNDNPHAVTADQVGAYTEAETDLEIQNAIDTHENASDPHPQYETSAEAQAKVDAHANRTDNPHSVTKTQVGLSNVPNVDATQRANHTGTQPASTITGLATVATSGDYNDLSNRPVFGTEFEDFSDLGNVNVTTSAFINAKTFTTQSKPTGRYRIAMQVHLKPGSPSSNYLLQLRVNGSQIGLEVEVEGKDSGTDIRVPEYLVGYYDHVGPGTFDIQLAAARESSTLIIHGAEAEVWRVS